MLTLFAILFHTVVLHPRKTPAEVEEERQKLHIAINSSFNGFVEKIAQLDSKDDAPNSVSGTAASKCFKTIAQK